MKTKIFGKTHSSDIRSILNKRSKIKVISTTDINFQLNNSTSSLSLSQPTRVSQLVNDKDYISSNNIDDIINIIPISTLEALDDWDLI